MEIRSNSLDNRLRLELKRNPLERRDQREVCPVVNVILVIVDICDDGLQAAGMPRRFAVPATFPTSGDVIGGMSVTIPLPPLAIERAARLISEARAAHWYGFRSVVG